MNVQLQLALSTLIVPLLLSFIAQRSGATHSRLIMPGIFAIWLSSYIWIIGLPSFPPGEAIEWLVFLGITCVFVGLIVKQSFQYAIAVQLLFIVVGFILLAWPVIAHSPTAQLFIELITLSFIGGIISFRISNTTPESPALTLGISNAGLAIVSGLGGSLLIGQLAAVLASALGAFIIYELYQKLMSTLLDTNTTFLIVLLNLCMLLIARVYAELPLIPVVLLALSLLLGLTTKWRYASGISLIAVCSSLTWLLLTTDNSSYY